MWEMQSVGLSSVVITKQEQSIILGLWSYFDDGCNLLSHHRALQSEPPHLQQELKDLKIMSTKYIIRNYTATGLIQADLIKGKITVAHHKVPATTEHFSRNTAVRTAGVFRIQNITGGKKTYRHISQLPGW